MSIKVAMWMAKAMDIHREELKAFLTVGLPEAQQSRFAEVFFVVRAGSHCVDGDPGSY